MSGIAINNLIAIPNMLLGKEGKPFLSTGISTLVGLTTIVAGSVMRNNSLQRDYDKAVGIRNQEIADLKARASKSPSTSYKNSVTPQESAALDEKQAQSEKHAGKMTDSETAVSAQLR